MNKTLNFAAILLIFLYGCSAPTATKNDCSVSEEGTKHGNLGTKYWQGGRFDIAEKETREAIKSDPTCSMFYQNLGVILNSLGRKDEASQSWIKSLQIDKNWCTATKTESFFGLGNYYYDKRDYGKSIDNFEKALNIATKENVDSKLLSQIYLYLSYNYTEPGNAYYNLEKAEDLKKKALDLQPDDLFIKASITKLLVLQSKLPEAKQNISDLISAQEKSPAPNAGVYSYLAHIFSLLNYPEQSARYMEKAIDLDKSQAQYLLNELDKDFRQVSSAREMQSVIAKAKTIREK
jgi:tetratricopeptide (TPR) repeat protein